MHVKLTFQPDGLRFLSFFSFCVLRGYMAPEYIMEGKVSHKLDMFSFGVILLRAIIGGMFKDGPPRGIWVSCCNTHHNISLLPFLGEQSFSSARDAFFVLLIFFSGL